MCRYKKKTAKRMICVACGDIYFSKTGKPVWCKKCYSKEYHKKNYNIYKIKKYCEICGNKFFTRKHAPRKTCSAVCAGKLMSQKIITSHQQRIIIKNCVVCGKPFKVGAPWAALKKFCSKRCRKCYGDRHESRFLSDRYIYNLIIGKTGGHKSLLKREDIPNSLIEVKRIQIKLIREKERI